MQPPLDLRGIKTRMEEPLHALVRQRCYAEAFDGLVNRYQDKVYRLALSYTRARARAEELAQDVFVKLWRALPRFDGRASLSTWLYVIARNTCLSALQYDARRRMLPLDEVDEPAAPAGRPPDLACDVRALVARLPEPQRRVVTLFYLENRSLREVGCMLDMPEGTLSHLHRARRSLAETLTAQGGL